jgi:hypothetical protein
MGYTIYIGNAELRGDWYQDSDPYAAWVVTTVRNENCEWPEVTGANFRSPSYTAWRDFCDKWGLASMFYAKHSGLLHHHPGCMPLNAEHLALVEQALAKFDATFPNALPRWCECAACVGPFGAVKDEQHEPLASGDKARLEWLRYWIKWALENCERPSVSNT